MDKRVEVNNFFNEVGAGFAALRVQYRLSDATQKLQECKRIKDEKKKAACIKEYSNKVEVAKKQLRLIQGASQLG